MHLILYYDDFSVSYMNMCNGKIHYFCGKVTLQIYWLCFSQMKRILIRYFSLHLNFISSQSQMDVDSGIETMEVDDSDMKFEIKRRRVYAFNN